MNRRSFFSTLIKGVGVFSILPPAETYARIWKARKPDLVPFWEQTICAERYMSAEYLDVIKAQLRACKRFRPPLHDPSADRIQKAFFDTVFANKRIDSFETFEVTYA